MAVPDNTDFRAWITLPVWVSRPETVPESEHQLSLFARAVGAVFNGVRDLILRVRREWIVSLCSGFFLKEHGKDRSVFIREGEDIEAYRLRVLEGLRAKTPGETKKGMRIALNTLGLRDYELLELYRLPVENPADKRWNEFEVRFADEGNEGLTDAEIQKRIDRAKPPRATGIPVRYRGALIQGFGRRFGRHFGT